HRFNPKAGAPHLVLVLARSTPGDRPRYQYQSTAPARVPGLVYAQSRASHQRPGGRERPGGRSFCVKPFRPLYHRLPRGLSREGAVSMSSPAPDDRGSAISSKPLIDQLQSSGHDEDWRRNWSMGTTDTEKVIPESEKIRPRVLTIRSPFSRSRRTNSPYLAK